MVDPDLGLTIVFNGCTYNHRELRGQLEREGYRFISTSDTEVILKAYWHWGRRCVERFAGMFALPSTSTTPAGWCWRATGWGIKPLYLAHTGQALRLASTLPALIAGGGVDRELDPVALHHYLSWHAVVPAPHTILRGVRKLPPPTVMIVEPDGRRTVETYWRASFTRQERYADWGADDWAEAVLGGLRGALQRRMVSDVPVGVLLSGGIDSS